MSDHFIVVGGNALAHRLTVELTTLYDAHATAIVPPEETPHTVQITKLLGAENTTVDATVNVVAKSAVACTVAVPGVVSFPCRVTCAAPGEIRGFSGCRSKFAVTVTGPVIVTVVDALPADATGPVQLPNRYGSPVVALTGTTVPAL